MGVVEDIADEIAVEALSAARKSGDDKIVDQVAEVLGATSTTTQEAYLTSIRVRRAEVRARELLKTFNAKIKD